MGKNRKGKSKKKSRRDEDGDGNVNADFIPEDAREIIQNLQEILTLHSEQEIYAMLLECKMDRVEAITRLLSQDTFQEVKSKRSKKKEAMEKKALMREEESSLYAYNVPDNCIEIVQKLKEVVNCSEQESYKMLVKCNMDPDEAVNRLLSQDTSFQQIESKQDEKKETKDISDCQGVGSSEQNHEFTNGSDSYVGQCGENKFNSDDTSNVQGICNRVAGSSTTSGILGPPSLNSDLTKRVPISSNGAVPSLSVPSSWLMSASGCGTSGQKTMTDVVKMNEAKAPFKDDCPLPEKRDVPISFIKSPPLNQLQEFARIEQLRESALVYNQKFQDDDYGGSRLLCDKYNNQNANDPSASVSLVECIAAWRAETFGPKMNGSGQPSGLPSQRLNDDSKDISDFADDLSFRALNIRGENEEQRLNRNVANEQINMNVARNYHASSNYDQTEPTKGNQNKSSSATDFTFDDSQLFNPVKSPSEPSPQRQNFTTFQNAMHQQAYTRELDPWDLYSPAISLLKEITASNSEPQMNGQAMNQQAYTREQDPQYSAPPLHQPMASINEPQMGQAMNQQAYTREPENLDSPLNQSMPNALSLGCRLSGSMTEAMASISEPQMNGQAMNQQAYIREPGPQYSASPLNQSMPTTSSLGGRTEAMSMASISKTHMNGQATNHHYSQPSVPSGHYGTLLPQHIKTDLSPSAVPFVPSAHRSTNGSTYNSAHGFGMSSDNNAANSRFGSDSIFSSQLNNQLPLFLHQNGNSNVRAPEGQNNSGSNYCGLFTGHQNQQSPGLRHNQQRQEQEQRYYESIHQESNNRRDHLTKPNNSHRQVTTTNQNPTNQS